MPGTQQVPINVGCCGGNHACDDNIWIFSVSVSGGRPAAL